MKINSVTLGIPVSHLSDAADWYRLVFQPEQEMSPVEDLIEMQLGNVWLQLFKGKPAPSEQILRFEVDDLDIEYQRLKDEGILTDQKIEVEGSIIKYLDFSDPDGNRLSLYRLYQED